MINNEITEKHFNKRELLVCITACLVIVTQSVISLFNGFIRLFITLPFKMDTLVIYGVLILIFLFSIKYIIKRSTPVMYFFIFLLIIDYLLAFLINSYYYEYFIKLGFDFAIKSIPWLILAYAVRDYKLFKKCLYISSLIILFSFIMNLFVFKTKIFGVSTYTQEYTYMLLPVAIIFADAIYEKKSILNIALFILVITFMLSMGARGPIVCVILYMLLKNYSIYKLNFKKFIISSIVLILLVLILYIFLNDILSYFLYLFQNLNLSTRIIERLIESNFFDDDARRVLIKYSIEVLEEHPLLGVGVGKDRILLAAKMGSTNLLSEATGWYPHNIFLEILLHFGLLIGSVVILFIIKLIYSSIISNKNKDSSDIICIFIGIGLFPLFFSSSYITSPLFFSFIGLSYYNYKCLK